MEYRIFEGDKLSDSVLISIVPSDLASVNFQQVTNSNFTSLTLFLKSFQSPPPPTKVTTKNPPPHHLPEQGVGLTTLLSIAYQGFSSMVLLTFYIR